MALCYVTRPINFCRHSCHSYYHCYGCAIITVDQDNPYIKTILN